MKKVLIITYYWPPAGGAGVQRILKFAKYLPQFGWQPIVLTVENPDSPIEDISLANDIPDECVVYKTKALEPFSLFKKFTGIRDDEKIPGDVLLNKDGATRKDKIAQWVRSNLFIPDGKIGWFPFAVKRGMKIIKNEKIDLIFTTSPPHTVGLIGRSLARKSNIKWVADFRDPWMEIVYYQNIKRSSITKAIDRSLERKVLKDAGGIISVSTDMINIFKSKVDRKNYYILPNGYDESDLTITNSEKNKKFIISYTGTMSKDRIPYPLITALQKLIFEDGINNIHLKFAGRFCQEFIELINKAEINNFFELNDFVPHKESMKILQTADMLLLMVDDVPNNKGFVTGKIFEYLGCKKPIFAIGPTDGNANDILKESDSGVMIDYKDTEGAYNLLKRMYNDWLNNKTVYKFNVEKYSRKKLTEQLTDIFSEIIE